MVEPAFKPKPVAQTTLVLRLCQIKVDYENPAKFNYTVPHDFTMTTKELEYVDFEGNKISITENFEIFPALLGKLKLGLPRPHIFFNSNINSVKEKQFEVFTVKDLKTTHFFLSNLSPPTPTSLRVGRKFPYLLSKGMIFDINDTLIEVKELEPEPTEQDESDPNHFYVNVIAKTKANQDEAPTLDKKKKVVKKEKKTKPPPKMLLRILKGKDPKDAGKDFKDFKYEPDPSGKEDMLVRVGSSPDAEVQLEGLLPVHLNLRFDSTVKKWKAFAEVDGMGGEGMVYLYLMDADDYRKQDTPKENKVSVLLREDMRIAFGGNEMEVHLT